MDNPGSISLNDFLRSYSPSRFTWESERFCSQSSIFWSTYGYGAATSKEEYGINAGLISDSHRSLSSADMSISTTASSEFMSCVSGHDGNSCTSLSSASSSSKIPFSVVAWLGIYDVKAIATPEPTRPAEKVDEELCFLAYTWTLSLFADVAQQAFETLSAASGSCTNSPRESVEPLSPTNSLERGMLVVTTRSPLFDPYEDTPILVNLKTRNTPSSGSVLKGKAGLIEMPNSINYDAINPEQPTTARSVCMWGRRLERIPKVRLPGQAEAIYCFDEHRLRQSQATTNMKVHQQSRSSRPVPEARNKQACVPLKGPQVKIQASTRGFPTSKSIGSFQPHGLPGNRPPLTQRTVAYGGGNVPFTGKAVK